MHELVVPKSIPKTLPILVTFLLFFIGLYGLVARRSIIKTILAL
jgi:NADH:ubiquinone oxidoreductase subunit K